MTTIAEVRMWGRTIGAVSLATGSDVAAFEYDPAFTGSGIEVAPLAMPLSTRGVSVCCTVTAKFSRLAGTACRFPAGPFR